MDNIYVADTGNSRIKVLSSGLEFKHHIINESLEGRSVTGICIGAEGDTILTVNWRSRTVTEITMEGKTIKGFSSDKFKEPIAIAINKTSGDVYVADNGIGAVLRRTN